MPRLCAALLVGLVTGASAHGHLLKAVLRPQAADEKAACAGNAGGACTGELSMRKLIARSQNEGPCPDPGPSAGQQADVPPGCEADFVCDHCGLEKVAAQKGIVGGDGAKWWTRMPAAHWDESDQWPINPCMSRDAFGAGGVGEVAPGDQLETTMYVNADHSGLYRFELGCSATADNAAFNAAPITQWKALHPTKELEPGDSLPAGREVGWTRAETDAYWARTICTAATCDYRMNAPYGPRDAPSSELNSAVCSAQLGQQPPSSDVGVTLDPNQVTCFVSDTFTIPGDTRDHRPPTPAPPTLAAMVTREASNPNHNPNRSLAPTSPSPGPAAVRQRCGGCGTRRRDSRRMQTASI